MAGRVSDAPRHHFAPGETAADVPSGNPPDVAQAAKLLGQAGVEVGRSAWEAMRHLRTLFAADLSLSRSAFGMTLAWAGAGIALGASAWLFFMTLLVLWLQSTGWVGWVGAVTLPAVVSAIGAAICVWRAVDVFGDTRLDATRRQLEKLGMAEDPEHVEKAPEQLP
jgi:uncharacterized membrane protein YqjE